MRTLHHFKADGIELAVSEFNESFSGLSAVCGDSSLVEYALEHFTNEKRRCQWLASRMLLREILGEHITVCNRVDGKPYLLNSSKHISISHTDGYVAVAVHDTCDVGVDIENSSRDARLLRRRFISSAEAEALDMENENTAVLLHCSAKEALFKIIGRKSSSYICGLYVSPFKVCSEGVFSISYIDDGVLIKRCNVNYIVCKNFILTFCVDCANSNNI